MPLIRAASTPSCVVLLPVTCQPRAESDIASGMPNHPNPTIATFFIRYLLIHLRSIRLR
ncbi:Uncharacterised protein [Shigella sonnei]|nr:Uncharacterised protein [Shigella sonnei]